jgi:hypothetical protein
MADVGTEVCGGVDSGLEFGRPSSTWLLFGFYFEFAIVSESTNTQLTYAEIILFFSLPYQDGGEDFPIDHRCLGQKATMPVICEPVLLGFKLEIINL